LEVRDGDLIDANSEDERDSRTEDELLSLWDDMDLLGDDAEAAAAEGVEAARAAKKARYEDYWQLRNLHKNDDNEWVADDYDENYSFSFDPDEAAQLKAQQGLNDDDIAAIETQRTQRYHALHDDFGSPTAYDPDFQPKVAADAMKEGSTWTEDQLRYTVSNALNKESPDTQAVVEQPNIIATNTNAKVTLVATGSIGDTLAEDVVIDFADGVRDLTDDEKLALSTAERSDFTIE